MNQRENSSILPSGYWKFFIPSPRPCDCAIIVRLLITTGNFTCALLPVLRSQFFRGHSTLFSYLFHSLIEEAETDFMGQRFDEARYCFYIAILTA